MIGFARQKFRLVCLLSNSAEGDMRAGAGGYSDAWDGMHCNEQAYDGSRGFAGCRRGWSGKFDLCVV